MPTLRNLQIDFATAILNNSGEDANFTRHLVDGKLSPDRQLGIYRNNVFGCLSDALKIAYPVTVKLVGTEFFEHLADEFIRQTPSENGNLHHFGGELAKFLTRFPPAQELAYLPDVARLEWACHEVFFAEDHLPLNSDRLAVVPEDQLEQLKFHLHPATRMLTSQFPIHQIWETNQEGFKGNPAVNLDRGGVSLLVRRNDYQPVLQPLTPGEWSFLNACQAGDDLFEASGSAQKTDPHFEIGATLKQFVVDSILVDFSQ
ncbi:hypothetical protein MNBD_NITROSPINAE05-1038 [hydrothermal vent metagenome]|uniref:Putative DNA-binding domain-containing protein n=1 Tax=hydrothermal vent metagenome TaxID=652676 RepID=A0A3B1D7Y2_9ZZZZ